MAELPLFDMDEEETRLRSPRGELGPRAGTFGANPINHGVGGTLRRIGGIFTDVGSGLSGGPTGRTRSILEDEEKQQAAADWRAYLSGLNLSPEEMSYAVDNPAEYKAEAFKQAQAKKKFDEMSSLFDDIGGMDPRTAALLKLNPEEGAKQLSRTAGTAQTGTYRDPVTNKWVIEPEIEGGFLLEPDDNGNLVSQQRPKSWDEINEETRLGISSRQVDETGRAARSREEIDRAEAVTRRMNAESTSRNSMKNSGTFTEPLVPSGPTPTQGQGFDVNRFDGARVVPIGIGVNGQWERGPNDGEMLNGIPTPTQNDLDLVDGKDADAVLKMERDELKKAQEVADQLTKRKDQSNEFLTITQDGEKPYITGDALWMATNHFPEFMSQWMDPRGDRLRMINKELTIDMGQGMKGAFSDADREFLQKGVPNADNREEANVDFAARQVAGANRANQYVTWLRNYERAFGAGTRRAAQAYWDDYKMANPVFDANGKAKERIPTITEWFAGDNSGAEADPFKKSVSPAYTDAKAGKKNAAEASDDELLDALGLR